MADRTAMCQKARYRGDGGHPPIGWSESPVRNADDPLGGSAATSARKASDGPWDGK